MQLHRTTARLTVIATASALLLTACGGSNDDTGKDGKIAGAHKEKTSPSPSEGKDEAAPTDFQKSDIKLPSDVHLIFDWEKPKNADEAAALQGAADYLRAIKHGKTKQDRKDPWVERTTVPEETAEEYAKINVGLSVKHKYSVTGTERFYQMQAKQIVKGKIMELTFCGNQEKLFSKNLKTGKALRTKKNPDDFSLYTIDMMKTSSEKKPWTAHSITDKLGGDECSQ